MKSGNMRLKRGVTLVELSIVIGIFMVILAEVIAFSSMIRMRTLKTEEINHRVNGVALLAEYIKADIEKSDVPGSDYLKIKIDDKDCKLSDTTVSGRPMWDGHYLNYARNTMNLNMIKDVRFKVQKVAEGEGGIKSLEAGDSNEDMIVCEIEYYRYKAGDAEHLGVYTLVLSRKTEYVGP